MKQLKALTFRNTRQLVEFVNEFNSNSENETKITKDDIVKIIFKESQVFLLYFN